MRVAPQLVARFAGAGGGRTLLLNGHIDVVSVELRERWAHDPFAAVVEDGRVHGRGACDMKGGIACMALAAEVLAALGVGLRGDLVVNTVTDEESTGAGGLVTARTLQADGAIVPEPSSLDVWIACRGSLLPTITVEGRAGHAGIAPRDPDEGGAVNAIEKMAIVLEAIRGMARALGTAATSPVPLPRRLRPHDHRRRRVDRVDPPRAGSSVTSSSCPTRPTSAAAGGASSGSSRSGSRAPWPPIRGCASTRRRSRGPRAPCRPRRSPATSRS